MCDTIQEKCEKAVAKKHSGYNCAQAVACTFCEEAGLDDETMRNLMQGFGAGLATMEGNCGAIAGAVAAAGMINKDQMNTFQDARLIMQQFMEQNGTVICKELKGIETGHVVRDCDDCVRDAVRFLKEALQK